MRYLELCFLSSQVIFFKSLISYVPLSNYPEYKTTPLLKKQTLPSLPIHLINPFINVGFFPSSSNFSFNLPWAQFFVLQQLTDLINQGIKGS